MKWLVVLCMSVVVLVSAVDMYWSIKVGKVLAETEENPIGRALIQIDNGDSALFMSVKMVGTILVVLSAIFIYQRNRRIATVVSISLAIFQLGLLLYLYGILCFFPTLGA